MSRMDEHDPIRDQDIEEKMPEKELPGTETPETEQPEPEMPEAETPETKLPETETPGTEAPETEETSVSQGADSRVPPEARRMAAAPYGTARPGARRPGTRPQTGYQRPPVPEKQPVPVRPRREAPASAERTAGGHDAGRSARIRVGYEPGRMSEGMTQQIPARERLRDMDRPGAAEAENEYSRNARAYLEKRKQTFRTEPDSRDDGPAGPEPKLLKAVVVLLLLAGAALTVLLFLRGRDSGEDALRNVPRVFSFDAPVTEGLTAPADLTFGAVTEKSVEEIRLRAVGDVELETVATSADNADGKLWLMKLHVETGFTGTAVLQVRRSGGEEWFDTDYASEVDVAPIPGLPTPTPAPTATPEPEEDESGNGADEWEDEPTEIPEELLWAGAEDEAGTEEAGTEEAGTEEFGTDEPGTEEFGTDEAEGGPGGEVTAAPLRTVQPTDTPAPATPEPTVTPALVAEAAPEANPELITATTVYTSATKKDKDYSRPAKELIRMPAADEYTTQRLGVMTFRGDNFRRNAAAGTLSSEPLSLGILWEAEAGSSRGVSQTYYGYGWTGQPVIARWSTQVRSKSNLYESKLETRSLKEVIIAGLDGNIRFLDLADGKLTRNSIKLGYPMRGTPTLHPRGYPFMSVGQFARKMKVKTGKIGLRQYNLYTQNELKLIDGLDSQYHRPLNSVGSFETSALIDRVSDTLIAVGTNGMLYLEALNTSFDYNMGVMTISPSTTVMTSKAKNQKNTALMAVESSPAAYDRYVYYADMGGILRCVNTDFLKPVWAVDTGDSVMAAIALDLTENRELNLYTANMLNNRKKGNSDIQIRRYDALSGREIWSTDIGVYKSKKDKDDVGAKASPVIGQYGLSDLVYFTVTGLSDAGREQLHTADDAAAALIALNKDTGRIVWSLGLSSRSESSPIAVYDEAGNGWIIQCEQNGAIHLLEGLTGREISSLKLEAEIEASPAAYGNVMVIGTTGKGTSSVYGIELKLAQTRESEDGDE